MDIDSLGTFNMSRVLYEKFFRVRVLSSWESPLPATHSLPSPVCYRTTEG